MTTLQSGVGYWNYIGHGGLDRFASEGLFLTTDLPLLANSVTPIVASLTCSAGRFEIPGWASLGEALVMKEDGGAVAAWTPSGLSYNTQALILNDLVKSLYDGNTRRSRALSRPSRRRDSSGSCCPSTTCWGIRRRGFADTVAE